MIKKTICFVLCFIFLILSFAACKDDDALNIVYPISVDPECVDPQIADNDTSLLIVRNCMEGLVRIGPDGSVLPGAASEWTVSDDGLKYTFRLRQDSEWQKLNAHKKILGEDCFDTFDYRVTADDFLFGIIRALRPETKAKDEIVRAHV